MTAHMSFDWLILRVETIYSLHAKIAVSGSKLPSVVANYCQWLQTVVSGSKLLSVGPTAVSGSKLLSMGPISNKLTTALFVLQNASIFLKSFLVTLFIIFSAFGNTCGIVVVVYQDISKDSKGFNSYLYYHC